MAIGAVATRWCQRRRHAGTRGDGRVRRVAATGATNGERAWSTDGHARGSDDGSPISGAGYGRCLGRAARRDRRRRAGRLRVPARPTRRCPTPCPTPARARCPTGTLRAARRRTGRPAAAIPTAVNIGRRPARQRDLRQRGRGRRARRGAARPPAAASTQARPTQRRRGHLRIDARRAAPRPSRRPTPPPARRSRPPPRCRPATSTPTCTGSARCPGSPGEGRRRPQAGAAAAS